VPIDGIGPNEAPTADEVAANMKRLAALGLEVQITEMDVKIQNGSGSEAERLEAQAALYGDMLRVCLEQEACTAFLTWASPTTTDGSPTSPVTTTRRCRSITPVSPNRPISGADRCAVGGGVSMFPHIQHHTPQPGQESVWDYPRPPRVEPPNRRIRALFGGQVVVDTAHAYRVLETSHLPVYYIPVADVDYESPDADASAYGLRVQGPRRLPGHYGRRQSRGRRGVALSAASASIPVAWMPASTTASRSKRSPVTSWAVGYLQRSSARSKAGQAHTVGRSLHDE
jgi:hypothetical protein